MEMSGQDKEIETPTTLVYNLIPNRDFSSSSSKLSSPTVGERSSSDHHDQPPHQTRTFILNEPPHHNLYPPPPPPPPPPPLARRQPTSDPDLSSTRIAPTSNRYPTRTAPPPPQATTTSTPSIRYRECLRNHAASMGSHVVDGCGEFMASGEDGTPESLRCAACECHRNFHRKEVEGELQPQPQTQHVPNYHSYYPNNKHNGHLHYPTTPSSSSLHHRLVSTTATPASLVPPVMMGFGGPAESSSEDLNNMLSVQAPSSLCSNKNKKRFRTKFSQHQKDRMMEFADKIDWKIHKHNDQEVHHFCSQLGLKRQVFKVWMHNNKQTSTNKKHH